MSDIKAALLANTPGADRVSAQEDVLKRREAAAGLGAPPKLSAVEQAKLDIAAAAKKAEAAKTQAAVDALAEASPYAEFDRRAKLGENMYPGNEQQLAGGYGINKPGVNLMAFTTTPENEAAVKQVLTEGRFLDNTTPLSITEDRQLRELGIDSVSAKALRDQAHMEKYRTFQVRLPPERQEEFRALMKSGKLGRAMRGEAEPVPVPAAEPAVPVVLPSASSLPAR